MPVVLQPSVSTSVTISSNCTPFEYKAADRTPMPAEVLPCRKKEGESLGCVLGLNVLQCLPPAWRIQFCPEQAINSKSPSPLRREGLFKDLGVRPVAGLGPESAVLRAAGIPHEAALAAQKDCRLSLQSRRPGQLHAAYG